MTEIEKIKCAKSFIDKLANGINPLDNTEIKADDVINNVRISRRFFFVSDILRQVIENGGTSKKKHAQVDFYLSPEQLLNFSYSESPIPVSEITKRLNLLIPDENMKKISHRDLTTWLISLDLLREEKTPEGKTRKLPTEHGGKIGISTELRNGQYGNYIVTVYNKTAQTFIIDNLNAVIELKYNNKN